MINEEEASVAKSKVDRDRLYQAVDSYIEDNYADDEEDDSSSLGILDIIKGRIFDKLGMPTILSGPDITDALDDLMQTECETFAETLLALIIGRGKKPVDVYTRAGISRQHFHKITHSADYQPTKETALAFAVALKLSLDETAELLESAGYMLSKKNKRDLIVEYFIKEKIYDVDEINFNLDERGFSPLTNRRSSKDE